MFNDSVIALCLINFRVNISVIIKYWYSYRCGGKAPSMVMSVYFLVGFCLTSVILFCVISPVGADYRLSC